MLLGVFLSFSSRAGMTPVFTALGASAKEILQGEWFRCATALLIHADAPHLVGNMAGLAIFGTAVCGITGAGVGILMISAAGVFGNLLNAVLHQSHHLSVGASTAVFGAVGILVAHQFRSRITGRSELTWRAFLPLGAGLALLGFLSAGPRTDILAHLLGMAAGGLLGAAYGMRCSRPPSRLVQTAGGVIVVAVFAAAWMSVTPGAF